MIDACPATFLLWLARAAVGQDASLPITVAQGPAAPAVAAPIDLTLQFDAPVPEALDVVRLDRSGSDRSWRLADATRHVVGAGRITAHGTAGADTLLLFRSPAHAGYILDGPFRWPSQPATAFVSVQWRRSLRGGVAGQGDATPTWLGAGEENAQRAWPVCFVGHEWECVGVPLAEAGVVVFRSAQGNVAYGIALGRVIQSGLEPVSTGQANWGRLLIVTAPPQLRQGSDRADAPRVSVRRVRTSRARPQSNRIDTETDTRVKVEKIGPRAYWVSGNEPPVDGWVEIQEKGFAPSRLDVRDVSAAPFELPLRVTLEPAVALSGRVLAGDGTAAPGAVTTLYRFLSDKPDKPDKPEKKDDGRRQKRIAIAEMTTDGEGAFRFDDLAAETYEVLAMHPVFGRGERRVEPGGQEIDISLRRSAVATGRVLRDGVAASGVAVTVLPDLAQFASSEDMTELRGGETTTDRDGRFAVPLASRGRGELRIGDERTGVRRIAVGPAETLPPVVDVGAIELAELPPVTLVLEQSDGCDLLLTGPAGRTGLIVTRSVRIGPAMFQARVPEPGTWFVMAVCGARERPVLPATIAVAPGARDLTIRLTWPVAR